jgi:hypothetical protein
MKILQVLINKLLDVAIMKSAPYDSSTNIVCYLLNALSVCTYAAIMNDPVYLLLKHWSSDF